MTDSARMLSRLVAVAFLVVIGLCAYAFTVHTKLVKAQDTLAVAQQDRDSWKTKFDGVQKDANAEKTTLNQCTTQVSTLQSQVAAAAAAEEQAKSQPHKRRS